MSTQQQTRGKRLKSNRPLDHGGPVAEAVRRTLAERKNASYADVAQEVRTKVAGARTTARSVASIVRGLRREGFAIPDRRLTKH